jgi:hypothetical protein
MLTRKEIILLKKLLSKVRATPGRSILELMPELQEWQTGCAVLDREMKALRDQGEPAPAAPEE